MIQSLAYKYCQQVMFSLKFLSVLLLLTCFTYQKITLQQLSALKEGDLTSGELIEVIQHAHSCQIDTLEKNYYTLKVVHKQKRKAYDRMNILYDIVIRILKKNKVIPHQNSLVQSKIKPQYLSKKRKWSFSMIFVIFGNQNELSRCFAELYKYGIQRLVTKPSINFLNQKMQALEIFSSAKVRLQKQLQRFSDFKIKEIQQIEIEGRQIINSEILQNQIQQQFSQSEQQIVGQQEFKEEAANKQKESVSIKVIFRVGQKEEEQSYDFYQQIEQDSPNSEDNSQEQSM